MPIAPCCSSVSCPGRHLPPPRRWAWRRWPSAGVAFILPMTNLPRVSDAQPAVSFDAVWKKFRRGERHDSLRDLLPALITRRFRADASALDAEEFWAVEDVSFEAHPGEALAIIG